MPNPRDFLPPPPWEGPPVPKAFTYSQHSLGLKAESWAKELRGLESELHLVRYSIEPYLSDMRVARLDDVIRETLERLSDAETSARRIFAEERFK